MWRRLTVSGVWDRDAQAGESAGADRSAQRFALKMGQVSVSGGLDPT